MPSEIMKSTDRSRISSRYLAALALVITPILAAIAQDAAPPVVTNLRYRDLTNRAEFQFTLADRGAFTKPVGDMNFENPVGLVPTAGLSPDLKTFCVEPAVPIYAGQDYQFAVEPMNMPKHYGLPNTPEAQTATDLRTRYIRELYGRYYGDTVQDPKVSAPAFQVALWEVIQEPTIPEGPLPFNLFNGAFRANYPNEAASPEYVQLAQKYVQSLTGDDTIFAQSQATSGSELVRLTGMPGADAFVPQSQVALRNAPGLASGSGGGGGGNGGFSPVGGTSPVLFGSGGGGSGLGRGGLGSPVGGAAPFLGGGGGGFFGGSGNNANVSTPATAAASTGTGTTTTPTGTTSSNGTSSPATTAVTPPTVVVPPTTPGGVSPPLPPVPVVPTKPTGPLTPVGPSVPAPAPLVLIAIGCAVFGVRRIHQKRNSATVS